MFSVAIILNMRKNLRFGHTKRMRYEKVYVGVLLHVDSDGIMKPVTIEWVNGVLYPITKIISVKLAPPRYVGSVNTKRYTVSVQGRTRELYLEKYSNKWFVEKLI